MATHLIESSYLDDLLILFLHMFIVFLITLLVMGLIKALFGLCIKEIGLWGLDTILGTEKRNKVECNNKDCEYREKGISIAAQFCLNVIFFLIYPLALINVCIKKVCFSAYTMEDDECSCEEKWIEYECEGSKSCRLRNRKSSMETSGKSTSNKSRSTPSPSLRYSSSEDKGT